MTFRNGVEHKSFAFEIVNKFRNHTGGQIIAVLDVS